MIITRTVLIAAGLMAAHLTGSPNLLVPGANPAPAPGALTPAQLMDRYEATQRRVYGSFSSRFESDNQGYINQHTVLEPGHRKDRNVVDIRSDGRRYFWCEEHSGQCFPELSLTTAATDPRAKCFLYDGRLCYRGGHEPLWMIERVVRRHTAGERLKARRDRLLVTVSDQFEAGSEFARKFRIGRSQPPEDPPDSLGTGGLFHEAGLIQRLRKAPTLALEPKLESIGGAPCYVLKASLLEKPKDAREPRPTTEHIYRLHIDPTHDYQIAKLEVTRTHRNLGGESAIRGPYLVETQTVDNVRFQKVGEAWVPMEWQRSLTVRRLDNPQLYQWEKSTVRRTRLLLNPDHAALGSFQPTFIQDGWGIQLKGFGGRFDHRGPLAWKGGRILDEAGRVVLPK